MYLNFVHSNKIYSLSFLFEVCNEVNEYMQELSELWWDQNTSITSF